MKSLNKSIKRFYFISQGPEVIFLSVTVYFFIIVTCVIHEQFIQAKKTNNKFNTQPLRAYKSLHLQTFNICWVYLGKHKIYNL